MTDLKQAAQQALEALVTCCAEEWRTLNNFGMKQVYDEKKVNAAIAALHAALAEPEQEPDGISWLKRDSGYFTAPTPRKPLTRDEAWAIWDRVVTRQTKGGDIAWQIAAEVEKHHRIGEQHE